MQHYLPILAQKGRAIRYARPVQNAVPVQFIDWLECQELTAKEIVEMLTRCLEVGYIAVMAGTVPAKEQPAIQDTVTVPPVDLEAYDSLYGDHRRKDRRGDQGMTRQNVSVMDNRHPGR